MQGRRLCAASIVAVVAALAFWGLAAASAYAAFNPHGTAIEVGGATSSSVIAALCWLTRHRVEADQRRALLVRNQELLIKTLAGVVPAQPAVRPLRPTRPYPVHRAL